jgi:hypothetical protein
MRLSRLGRNCRNSDHAKRLARGTGLSGRHSQPRPAARFSLRHKASFLSRGPPREQAKDVQSRASRQQRNIFDSPSRGPLSPRSPHGMHERQPCRPAPLRPRHAKSRHRLPRAANRWNNFASFLNPPTNACPITALPPCSRGVRSAFSNDGSASSKAFGRRKRLPDESEGSLRRKRECSGLKQKPSPCQCALLHILALPMLVLGSRPAGTVLAK